MGPTIPLYDPSSNNWMFRLEYLRIAKCVSLTSFMFVKGRLAALKELPVGNARERSRWKRDHCKIAEFFDN